jgi:YbgC/YbaW family acyl-CoA thioester hydrolase
VPVAGETPLASRDSTAIAHGAAPGDSLNRADNRMKIPLATRYVDYDNKSHVNNAVYLTYFEIARAHVWREVLGLPDDPAFVLAEATVRYLSPAMLGEPLEIEIRTGEIRTKAWAWESTRSDARRTGARSRKEVRCKSGSTTSGGRRRRFRRTLRRS